VWVRNYYDLVAGLADISPDAARIPLSAAEFSAQAAELVHPDDAVLLRLLQLPRDNRNLITLLEKQDRVFEPGCLWVEKRAKTAETGGAAGTGGGFGERLDGLDQRLAGVDIDTRIAVGQALLVIMRGNGLPRGLWCGMFGTEFRWPEDTSSHVVCNGFSPPPSGRAASFDLFGPSGRRSGGRCLCRARP
jgi:hypothetical protein